jgi:hypothetical protein
MSCLGKTSKNGLKLRCSEAYIEEHQGFHEQGTLKVVRSEPGAKILKTTTRADYKVTNGVFKKRKIQLRMCGNQQEEGVHYKLL